MPGLGIDLIEIERLERALERHPRLAGRLFTGAELAYANAHRRPGRHLAARFAAKEAVIKALGIEEGFGLRSVEVLSDGPPKVRLSGRPAEAAAHQGVEVAVSLTHSREHAAAAAMVLPAR